MGSVVLNIPVLFNLAEHWWRAVGSSGWMCLPVLGWKCPGMNPMSKMLC